MQGFSELLHHFIVKSRYDEDMYAEYYLVRATTEYQTEPGVTTMIPRLFVTTISGMKNTQLAFKFTSFVPVDSVPLAHLEPPSDQMGGAPVSAADFNTTFCASTVDFTSSEKIMPLARISKPPGYGLAPYLSQPDASYFIIDLQLSPFTTAAQWVARDEELSANRTAREMQLRARRMSRDERAPGICLKRT